MIARGLLLSLLCAALVAPTTGLAADRVREIRLEGPPGVDVAELLPLIAVEEGEPISRRGVRRSVQLLFETGRFSNVTALRETLDDGGTALVFRLEPKRIVRALQIVGAERLDEERLRRAVGFQVGAEFSEDLLATAAAGLEAALARIGFENAVINPVVEQEESDVRVRLEVREGPPTRLAVLRFVGDPGDPTIREVALPVREGEIFRREELDEGLQRLRNSYRRAGYYRAQVGQPRIRRVGTHEVEVEVRVEAGPQIRFAFQGNRLFREENLREALAYQGDELLDTAMVAELAERVERTYRRAGWLDARVTTFEEVSPDETRARIVFQVSEGRPLQVRSILFDGNEEVRDERLRAWAEEEIAAAYGPRALVRSPERGETDLALGDRRAKVPTTLRPREIYDEQIYDEVVQGLLARYRDEGFLEVQIRPATLETDERTRLGDVRIAVDEGRRTYVYKVEIEGAEDEAPLQLLRPTVRPRDPLSERRIEAQRIEIRSLFARFGYLFASVRSEIVRPPEDPWHAIVRFHIHQGPKVRVGRILSQGNHRTKDWVIRQTLGFAEGDVLGSESIASSQQELMRLGLFRAATVRLIDPDLPEEVKDIVVEVRERPGRTLEVGGGLSIADGPRAFGEFTERNILGRNLQLHLRGRVNYQVFRDDVRDMDLEDGLERFLDLGVTFPRIWGIDLPVGWRMDLVHERDIRLAYHLTRNAAITGFDFHFSRAFAGTLRFELESNHIEHSQRFDDLFGALSRTDFDLLRFPRGTTLLGSVRPGLALDLRDSVTSPHAGLLAKVETEFARSVGGQTLVDFVKVSGSVTGYVPVSRRTTLVLLAGAGQVFPLQEGSITLPPKRFFLGGADSIRGFTEDGLVPQDRRAALRQEIADCRALFFRSGCTPQARFLEAGRAVPSEGGDFFVLGRAELRFPLQGNLMGGVFLDAGNLWIDPKEVDLAALRHAAGFGLRYATPVGPLALDLGFNLDPDPTINEQLMAVHFSVGLF